MKYEFTNLAHRDLNTIGIPTMNRRGGNRGGGNRGGGNLIEEVNALLKNYYILNKDNLFGKKGDILKFVRQNNPSYCTIQKQNGVLHSFAADIEWCLRDGILSPLTIEKLLPSTPPVIPKKESGKFSCYEIHTVQARMFGCSTQCEECKTKQNEKNNG